VPAAVPSVCHNSLPLWGSLAVNKNRVPMRVSLPGALGELPG
jgi:hypothetical protein